MNNDNEQQSRAENINDYITAYKEIESRVNLLSEKLSLIKNYSEMYKKAEKTISAVSKISVEQEILIPLGGNIMLPAKVSPESMPIMALGAGIHKEMSSEDIAIKLNERIRSLNSVESDVLNEINDLSVKKIFLAARIQEMSKNVQ